MVFENTRNTILVFSKNCSYFLNLVFSVFSKKKTRNQTCFMFSMFYVFENIKQFLKIRTKWPICFLSFFTVFTLHYIGVVLHSWIRTYDLP